MIRRYVWAADRLVGFARAGSGARPPECCLGKRVHGTAELCSARKDKSCSPTWATAESPPLPLEAATPAAQGSRIELNWRPGVFCLYSIFLADSQNIRMRCRRSQINRTGGRALGSCGCTDLESGIGCGVRMREAGMAVRCKKHAPRTSQTVRHWDLGHRGPCWWRTALSARKQPNVSGRVPLRAGRPVHEPVSERSSIRPRERLSRSRVSLEIQAAE